MQVFNPSKGGGGRLQEHLSPEIVETGVNKESVE